MGIKDDTAYLFYVVPFAVVLVGAVLYAWRLGRSDEAAHGAYAALHSPSVTQARNAFDRRVAMAVRAAKLGFLECAGCGFANAQRTACCVLCGVALTETTGERRRFWQRRGSDRAGTNTPSGEGLEAMVAGGVSERQQRIRRRKEWLREVDDEGHVAWRHDATALSVEAREFAFYVLQSETVPHTPLEDPAGVVVRHELRSSTISAHSTSVQSETTVEVVVDTAEPVVTTAGVARALACKLDQITTVAINVVTADAAHIAYASQDSGSTTSTLSIMDSIRSAQLDFPTKLAHFVTSMASRFTRTDGTGSAAISRLAINRATLLTDSLDALATLSPSAATGAVRVEFLGEQGIDAGGVYREWFLLLNEQIVKPSAGIFVCVDERDQTFYLSPLSREMLGEHHLAHIFAAGRLLGRALLEGNVTGFHLALPLLKIILGLPVGFNDLAYFDPDVHKNLQWLMDNDGVDMLGLDFTVTQLLPDGTTREVELVPGGCQIDVTDANKHEYVDRKLQYLLFDSVAPQLFAFLRGLYEVVPAELLVLFDAEELDYVLSGSDEIDVEDWERNTVTSKNLAYYPADELFWEVVRSLTPDQRRRLLQFATGSTRVPPGGFAALTSNDGQLCLFTLRGVTTRETRGYLHSHACFNRVDLPMHKSVKEMRRAVLAAIAGESIGFTTD